jgi:hypothetical protein
MVEELDVTEVVRAVELVRETYRASQLRFWGWERAPRDDGDSYERIKPLQSRA